MCVRAWGAANRLRSGRGSIHIRNLSRALYIYGSSFLGSDIARSPAWVIAITRGSLTAYISSTLYIAVE